MAQSKVKDFAADLYAYLWSKHKFNTQSLEECFSEKVDSEKFQQVIQERYFNQDIGKAVLCSQYLLRHLCHYFFRYAEKGIEEFSEIMRCVSVITVAWTLERSNQFVKFIDTCAIIAEVILFFDSKSESPRNPFEAAQVLISFLELDEGYKLFEMGGWKRLQEVAREQYSCIISFLDISKLNSAYEFPIYNCEFVKLLMKSPVFFPVPKSKVCRQCLEQLDDTKVHCFDILKLFKEYDDIFVYTSPEVEDSKSKEINSVPTPTEADESGEEIEDVSKSFLCLFVGTVHVLKGSEVD